MKLVVDIDGTICNSDSSYEFSEPISSRIGYLNKRYDDGDTIIYFTARGMGSSNENVEVSYNKYYELTKKQLNSWGAKYHYLILGKPSADMYIDDKAIQADIFFGGQMLNNDREIVEKGWGYEEILVNKSLYCSKILHMNRGKKLSWHYHNIKDETFYVENGCVELRYGWDDDIDKSERTTLCHGDTFHVPTGLRHRLIAIENSRVFETSTQHFDDDSIRVIKGD